MVRENGVEGNVMRLRLKVWDIAHPESQPYGKRLGF
jgi:hypothetical protein